MNYTQWISRCWCKSAAVIVLAGCVSTPPIDELLRASKLPREVLSALDAGDYQAAYPRLVELAALDQHEATFVLGNYYLCGKIVDFDCGKAEALFERSSRPSKSDASADLVTRSRNEVAWINSACEQPGFMRKPRVALRIAEEAARDGDAYRVDTLAAAHANLGDFAKAAQLQRDAIVALARQTKDEPVLDKTVAEFRVRLSLYERGEPARFGAWNAAENCNALP